MIFLINNNQNSKIKYFKKLKSDKDLRIEDKKIAVEGLLPILRAIESGLTIDYLLIRENEVVEPFNNIENKFMCKSKIIDSISSHKNEKYMAVINFDNNINLKDIKGPILILDNIENPGNIGAICRSAESFGVVNIILTDSSSDPFSSRAIHNSRGAIFFINVVKCSEEEINKYLLNSGYNVFLAHCSDKSRSLHTVDVTDTTAFVMGNEHKGVSDFWTKKHKAVHIPMIGHSDSLNVSVASSIICYHIFINRT